MKGSEVMDEVSNNTEYILRMVLEIAKRCQTVEEVQAAILEILAGTK